MDSLKIGGKVMLIDMDAMSKIILIEPKTKERCDEESTKVETFDEKGELITYNITTNKYTEDRQIDTSRYDIIRTMLDILLSYEEVIDDTLGFARGIGNTPLNVKIAINTLLKYNILIELN